MKRIIKKIFTLMILFVAGFSMSGCKPEIVYVDKEVEKLVYTSSVEEGTYTIYHLLQKDTLGNTISDYELNEKQNDTFVAEDSTLPSMSKNITGFSAKAMAVNETVIYIFYNRKEVSYTFLVENHGEFSDGAEEKTIKGKYGTKVSSPTVNSSTHYFTGWVTDSEETVPSVFGDVDLIFKATWIDKTSFSDNWYESPVDATTGEAATKSSQYIYFGVFPKSVLAENSSVLIYESGEIEVGGNKYYRGSDGNLYEKVTAKLYSSTESDGQVYSDNSKIKKGAVRYFKVEPIMWKVLTTDYNGTGKALLHAVDAVIANVPYYLNSTNRIIDDKTIYPNNYKYSTVRAYLNGKYEADDTQNKTMYEGKGFLQTAFTVSAQALILDTEVDNSKETTGYTSDSYAELYACENTTDKIFLLSASDVIKSEYGFNTVAGTDNGDNSVDTTGRLRSATDYALAKYAFRNTKKSLTGSYWWLRSPEKNSSEKVACVSSSGSAGNDDIFYSEDCTVPALTITLE